MEIRRKLAPNSLDLAESFNHLGGVEAALGNPAKAEGYARSALAIGQASAPESLLVAESLYFLGKAASERGTLTRAEDYTQQALDLQQKLAPGSRDVALSLVFLGSLAGRRGDVARQEEYVHRAQEISEKLYPIEQALILDGLGDVCLHQANLESAEQYFLQALEIRQRLRPGSLAVAASFAKLGNVISNRGDPDRAEEYFRNALEIRQSFAPGGLRVADSLINLGMVEFARGRLAEAERFLRQALTIQRQLAPRSLSEALSLHGLGAVFWSRQELSRAEEYFLRAKEIRQALAPEGPDLAQSFSWLGVVLAGRGDLTHAEEYFLQALAISEKESPESLPVAQMLEDLGGIAERRGDQLRAEDYYRQALAIQVRHAPGSPAEAFTLVRLGDLARTHSNPDEAAKYLGRALLIFEKALPGSLSHAGTLVSLTWLRRDQHQIEAALQLYAQAIDILDREMAQMGGTDDIRSVFRAQFETYYKSYVDLLIERKQPELAFHVMERSRARTLLEFLENARIDINSGVDPRLLRAERSLRESISAKSSYRIRLLDGGVNGEKLAALDKQIGDLREQYEEVKSQIRLKSPAYAALSQPQPLTAKEVQEQLLDENTMLLEYSLGESRSHVWALTQNSLAVFDLPPRSVIDKAVRNVYELLTAPSRRLEKETVAQRRIRLAKAEADYPAAAAELSRMILGPVAPLLDRKRLLIVGDGSLQYLPFAALPAPLVPASVGSASRSGPSASSKDGKNPPLVVGHEIVNLPSASTLAELRRIRVARTEPPRSVAVFADPVFDPRDERVQPSSKAPHAALKTIAQTQPPLSSSQERLARSAADLGLVRDGRVYLSRLLWTEREAAAILNVTPAGQSMEAVGFGANRATAISPSLAQYRIVHFATHALVDSKNPELSGLVLSLVNQRGQGEDGFLDLEQIYNLNLPADLVVLSACDTALGQEIRGEGLIGLARGFMYAGASRVMASLWSVDDEVTSELMARFYRALQRDKMSPAAALRTAQIEVAKEKQWRSPFYWAGFQIQGEWK
jgi:CHAT domain-containing protein/tetratricopeptide (TPR) repeat protein